MQKKLLIIVSDDVSCLNGVRFVGSFFRNKSSVSATLFYVAPRVDTPAGKTGFEPLRLDEKAVEAGRKKAQKALDTACQLLSDRGFPAENIIPKFTFRQFGTVKDIMTEAKMGVYDAVILGRRGYSHFESILSTSETREILESDIDFPVWICRRPDENRKNVLLCVDGSAASLRMVDHVGSILEGENEHSVTLFHAYTEGSEGTETILRRARDRLLERWVCDGRIDSIAVASTMTGVANTILEKAEAKGYAAVGVGRVGVKKGRLAEWMVGSRTMKLLETIEKAALWVSS